MFTGIIKEIGRVEKIIKQGSLTKLGIGSKELWNDADISDSIAVNGVCLTVVKKEKNLIFFDAVDSTIGVSNLKRLKKNDCVNLEPALKMGDKLGGHFVLGHVDGEVKLRRIIKLKDYHQIEIDLLSANKKFILENGSVALEGISLTVKKVLPRIFTVNVIPFTFAHTNLKYKRLGDWVNIEFDHLLKSTDIHR
jgi:riboflavin synthase